jgi:hypothetical protein
LHEELIRVRERVCAHTNEEIGAGWVSDSSGMLGISAPALLPAWRPLGRDLFPDISELAESQKVRFVEGVRELLQLQSP